ncbi:glutaredoxin family protein [Candidatus Saccharibacteria bacterium]|nr:glutaredoxin family protein [Candidatus Saccharibacteria bacterium]
MKITIYSTVHCPYCVMLKRWLDEQNVQYTDYLVDQNPVAAREMIRLSGQMGVPFSTVEWGDGEMQKILGFDRASFDAAFKKAAEAK